MPSLHLISIPQLSLTTRKYKTLSQRLVIHKHGCKIQVNRFTVPSSSSSWVARGVDQESQQFEVDPDKAREALQQLDQQLESLSRKQANAPKARASDVGGDQMMEEEEREFSESSLASVAVVLIAFTIFYNILFYAVIKPSIDVAETVSDLPAVRESLETALLQQLPFSSQFPFRL